MSRTLVCNERSGGAVRVGEGAESPLVVEYTVMNSERRLAQLARGETWTFGRAADCSQSLAVPALSRRALAIEHLTSGVVRVTSRQSHLGRVIVSSDDGHQHHSLSLGAAPVHLSGGNYTVKVELPPIVLRMVVAVPHARSRPLPPAGVISPRRLAERTAVGWTPSRRHDSLGGGDWITVAALAVTLHRYPELVPKSATGRPVTTSEALRQVAAIWCGHSSHYWVNERLKEALAAADLESAPGGERLGPAVAHYERLFTQGSVRELRDALAPLLGGQADA